MPLVVALRNTSPAPICVNARMGMGYEDGLVRELYFTMCDADGTLLRVPDGARVDVHRVPPRRQDFTELAAGGAVETTVDPSFWFPFPHPGRFSIVFTYENRWAGRELGVEAFTGTVSAPTLKLGPRRAQFYRVVKEKIKAASTAAALARSLQRKEPGA